MQYFLYVGTQIHYVTLFLSIICMLCLIVAYGCGYKKELKIIGITLFISIILFILCPSDAVVWDKVEKYQEQNHNLELQNLKLQSELDKCKIKYSSFED